MALFNLNNLQGQIDSVNNDLSTNYATKTYADTAVAGVDLTPVNTRIGDVETNLADNYTTTTDLSNNYTLKTYVDGEITLARTDLGADIDTANARIDTANTNIATANSNITALQNKTLKITDTGAGVKVTGTLQSTGAITSGDDITAFGSVS